jgi:hypothetical protein
MYYFFFLHIAIKIFHPDKNSFAKKNPSLDGRENLPILENKALALAFLSRELE